MLENPSILRYSPRAFSAVTMREVRKTSRKGSGIFLGILRDHTPTLFLSNKGRRRDGPDLTAT